MLVWITKFAEVNFTTHFLRVKINKRDWESGELIIYENKLTCIASWEISSSSV